MKLILNSSSISLNRFHLLAAYWPPFLSRKMEKSEFEQFREEMSEFLKSQADYMNPTQICVCLVAYSLLMLYHNSSSEEYLEIWKEKFDEMYKIFLNDFKRKHSE